MPPPIRAIFLDFDGTLVDSEPLHHECWVQAIRPYGGDIGWEDYASRMVGITDSSAARILLSEAGVSPTSEIIEQACKVKKSAYVARVVAEVGIDKATISWITSRPEDLYLGVVSSSHGFEVIPVLSNANVLDTLDLLICAEHVQRRKPDPEPYLLAVERVNQNLRQAASARQVSAAGQGVLAGQPPRRTNTDRSLGMSGGRGLRRRRRGGDGRRYAR